MIIKLNHGKAIRQKESKSDKNENGMITNDASKHQHK